MLLPHFFTKEIFGSELEADDGLQSTFLHTFFPDHH